MFDSRSRLAQILIEAGQLNLGTSYQERLGELRSETGSFYTPRELVDLILEATLRPVIATASNVLNLKIVDPSCGTGHFLTAAFDMLSTAFPELPPHEIVQTLYGVDIDPGALAVAKEELYRRSGVHPLHLRLADAIDMAGDRKEPSIAWRAWGDFDVVIGNPPFRTAIQAGSPPIFRHHFPDLGGTADLAYYFMDLATRIVKPGGRIGFVLPRAFLSAPAAKALRARSLQSSLRPNLIYASPASDHFDDAAIFVTVVALGPDDIARVGYGLLGDVEWQTRPIIGDNWWAELFGGNAPIAGLTLGDIFQVESSLCVADAYDLVPFVSEGGEGQRLVTCGLIDPGKCWWGEKTCRFLKHKFQMPMVSIAQSKSLLKRLNKSRRPKVLVAGLSRRIEAFLDADGQYLGSVGTYSIFHPEDSVEVLRALSAFLATEEPSRSLTLEWGSTAMGGGSITVRKEFLQSLPCELT